MKRLCIICGREAVSGNFCKECFLKRHKLFEINDFGIVLCTNEDSYYLGKWKEFAGTKTMLDDFVSHNIKRIGKIKRLSIFFKSFKNGYKVRVQGSGRVNSLQKKELKEIETSIKRKLCDICVKLSGRYHEARIQIRGEHADKIISRMQNTLPKTSWIEKNKYGYDVFFLNKAEAGEAAKHLRKRYQVKKSFKVVGAKKGKMLMRDFYSIR